MIITGEVSIWAVPRSKWDRDQNPENPDPFRYELSTSTVWADGAIKVCSEEISLEMPKDVDLLGQALATLKAKQEQIMADAQCKVTELQAQINDLLLLTHQPEPNVINDDIPF